MKNTVTQLLEGSVIPEENYTMRNKRILDCIREATDDEKVCTTFPVQKVIVSESNGNYIMEFDNNVERYMKTQNISLLEAMNNIAYANKIDVKDCVLLVREDTITKIDLSAALKRTKFDIAKY